MSRRTRDQLQTFRYDPHRLDQRRTHEMSMQERVSMIQTLLDACRFVLEDQGEALSSYWLASLVMEMKLWRASESEVRAALDKDIEEFAGSSPFVKASENEYALRSWTAE